MSEVEQMQCLSRAVVGGLYVRASMGLHYFIIKVPVHLCYTTENPS